MSQPNTDTIVNVSQLYKRFCKDMKWSMWYGLLDLVQNRTFHSAEDLHLRNHEFWAIQNLDLEIKRGQSIGLIGRNGSGKTTLMRLISEIIPFTFGNLKVNGKVTPIFRLRSGMHPHYTGRDYIYIQSAMHGMNKAKVDEKLDYIIEFSELQEFIDSPIGTYSSGMKARLGYSIAIASEFDLLIIDEALAVGDTEFRDKCIQNLKEISREKALVFVSHNMDMVREVSNSIVVLERGQKIMETFDVQQGIDYYYEYIKKDKKPKLEPQTRIIIDKAGPTPAEAVNLPKEPLKHNLELISLHIPKTAGTSFRNVLEQQYGKALGKFDIRNGKMLLDDQLHFGASLPPHLKVIHGHFFYKNLKEAIDLESKEVPMVTWLRHPVKRVVSNYFYLARRMGEEMQEEQKGLNLLVKMQKSLLEYARSDFARNRMHTFLKDIELDMFFFVGLTEHFEEDTKRLAKRLGWKNVNIPQVNETGDYPIELEDYVIKEIEELNAKDMSLYYEALELRNSVELGGI